MKAIFQLFISWIFLLIGFHNSFAQNQDIQKIENYFTRIDDLVNKEKDNPKIFLNKELLLKAKSETEGINKINVCLDLYTFFIYRSTEKAKYHNDEAMKLSVDMGYKKGRFKALCNNAYIMFVEGQFDKALSIIRNAISNNQLNTFPDIKAEFQTLSSYIHTEQGLYDTSLEICLNLIKEAEASNNHYALMRAYSATSHFYLRLGAIEKALEYCLKGLDIILKLKKVQYLFPKIDEIARMVHALEGSRNALEIYQYYLDLEKRISGPGDYIESVVYMNIAEIYIEEKKFKKAEGILLTAMHLITVNGYGFRKPRIHEIMGKLRLEMSDTVKAIESYERGLKAATEIKAFDVVKNASGVLAELHKLRGKTEVAEEYLNLYTKITDSLFSTETNQRVKIIEAQLKISEISRQKEVLELKNRSQEERYRFTFLVLILALISAGIAGFSYVKVKKKNRLLFNRTKELAFTQLRDLDKEEIKANRNESLVVNAKNNQKQNYIQDDVKEIILTKLKRFEEDKFYLNPNCNLNQLSDELQTNQKYLSQVINQEKKSNFNNYLNGLRINHLLQRLVEDKEFRNSKLSYIGVVSGFNNLNTFNTAFKKRLGILPSYFIKKLNDDERME